MALFEICDAYLLRKGLAKEDRIEERTMAENISGAWSAYTTDLNEEATAVFNEALKELVGVTYRPMAVSIQIADGTNYSFFCNASGVYPGSENQGAMIDIYRAPGNPPQIKEIRLLNP
jgi:hypothetical protein